MRKLYRFITTQVEQVNEHGYSQGYCRRKK